MRLQLAPLVLLLSTPAVADEAITVQTELPIYARPFVGVAAGGTERRVLSRWRSWLRIARAGEARGGWIPSYRAEAAKKRSRAKRSETTRS